MNVYAILARLTTDSKNYPEFEQTFWVIAGSPKQASGCLKKYFKTNDVPCITGYTTHWFRAGSSVYMDEPELIRENIITCSNLAINGYSRAKRSRRH